MPIVPVVNVGAVAPYVTTYASPTPYLTPNEYLNAATGVDTSTLIFQGTGLQQEEALRAICSRASSFADRICDQVLGATVDTENGRVRSNRQGEWYVHPKFWPVIEVRSFAMGDTPAGLVAQDLSSTFVEPQSFTVISGALPTMSSQGPLQFGGGAPGRSLFAQWTYVSGWPNTVLAADATKTATSIQVSSAIGIYPGSTLQIYDDPNTEPVTVANSYVGGAGSSTTLPLNAGLLNAHAIGTSVSALPPSIKQAAINLTSFLIKTRGAEALMMRPLAPEPSGVGQLEPGGVEDLAVASELLAPFARVR